MSLSDRCRPIELILSDVDGVLTDGGVIFDNKGIELKRFHIRDGSGIKLWQRAGGKFGLITGRTSHIVEVRATELDVELVRQGTENKLAALGEIIGELRLRLDQVCYVGDDLPDLPVVRKVGLGVAVGDAAEELKKEAHFVTKSHGGFGAIRETIELVLKHQQRWTDLVQAFYQ